MLTKKKRSETTHRYRNLRDGHVDQLGVGFRHGQRGHATAVPSERGERKCHPHSPGISSRQSRGHLGRNEDSVVVHVSLSLSLSHEFYRSPIDFHTSVHLLRHIFLQSPSKIKDSSSTEFLPLSSYGLHFVVSRQSKGEPHSLKLIRKVSTFFLSFRGYLVFRLVWSFWRSFSGNQRLWRDFFISNDSR